jgi:hypothetical protein
MPQLSSIRRGRLGVLLAASCLAGASIAGPLAAQELSGRTVEFVIPFSGSGGSTEGANWFQGNQGAGDGTTGGPCSPPGPAASSTCRPTSPSAGTALPMASRTSSSSTAARDYGVTRN